MSLFSFQKCIKRTIPTFYQKNWTKQLSFVKDNQDFLNLVKDHGEGSITLKRREKILDIIISNPSKRNAISGKMMYQLALIADEVKAELETDSQIACLTIRGEGTEAFCAGADINLAQQVLTSPEKGAMMAKFMNSTLNFFRQSGLISVCLVNGPALGGGAEISTVGDFRIIAGNGKAFIQFVQAKVGAAPGWGGGRRLVSVVGRKQAIKLFGSSMRVTPSEALLLGLVDEVAEITDSNSWDDVSLRFLEPYVNQPFPKSLQAIKTGIASSETLPSDEAINKEINLFQSRWQSKDNTQAFSKTLNDISSKGKK